MTIPTPPLSTITLDFACSQILDCAEAHSLITTTGQYCVSLTELYTYLPGLKRQMMVAKTVLLSAECKVSVTRANARAKERRDLIDLDVLAFLEIKIKRTGLNTISVRDNLLVVSDASLAKYLEHTPS